MNQLSGNFVCKTLNLTILQAWYSISLLKDLPILADIGFSFQPKLILRKKNLRKKKRKTRS